MQLPLSGFRRGIERRASAVAETHALAGARSVLFWPDRAPEAASSAARSHGGELAQGVTVIVHDEAAVGTFVAQPSLTASVTL
jgi:hypothetical protein